MVYLTMKLFYSFGSLFVFDPNNLSLQVQSEIQSTSTLTIPALPRSYCHPMKSYIVTGGLGGFGLELAQWLIDRGAKFLTLTSRSGIRTGYQARKVEKWRRQGISVLVSKHDIVDIRATEELIRETTQMGQVGGLFHLAMVSK